jgi:hypothetical protein
MLLTLDEQFGIYIAGIDNILSGQQVFVHESFMDELRSRII